MQDLNVTRAKTTLPNRSHPQAQEFVLQSILETVKHYDLDAVHFDDYFYPYRIANQVFPDSVSYASYGSSFGTVDEWRRNNVDYFVKELSSRIKREATSPHRSANRGSAGSRRRT